MALATMGTTSVDNESRDKFVSFLSDSIEKEMIKNQERERENWVPDIILDVDYGACKKLSEAGEYAGIPDSNFPWKTCMWIDKNHVSVSYGYRANEEYLYANRTYWRSKINSLKSSIEEYRSGEMLSWIENEEERNATAKERISDIEKRITEYQSNFEKAEE